MISSTHRARPEGAGVGILGTGSCLPATRVSNEEVERSVRQEEGWVRQRIGVLERRFVSDDETGFDLAVGAARQALEASGVDPLQIGAVVLATSTADLPIPGIGSRVQGAVGASNAMAFDVNAACAGFLVGCEVGRGFLTADPGMETVLIVASDTYSRVLDPADRRTYPLFGDGAGAVVLGRVPASEGMLGSQVYTDGTLAHFVTGGPGLPVPAAGSANTDHYLKMSGRDVADLVRLEFPRLVNDALKESGLTLDQIDHLVCHQANPHLITACAERAGFRPEQIVLTGDLLGNTGAASIPIGLDVAARDGRLRPGDNILMITFGAGMTWGRAMMRWSEAGCRTVEAVRA
ncbi:3-oxoacyl-ACP synthase III family protein [Streptomyces sp. NBC_00454]|uniref:3-oxoacyl-ACP synthase III family protein n=1 Tax=Streptomyces sp. NBC_00454 TaxID=2975747 RepID=UPI0030E485F4